MPMMYGGFGGYGYSPQWGYSIPVMPSPATIEEGKQTPILPGQMHMAHDFHPFKK